MGVEKIKKHDMTGDEKETGYRGLHPGMDLRPASGVYGNAPFRSGIEAVLVVEGPSRRESCAALACW
jgi:hypothetical protein